MNVPLRIILALAGGGAVFVILVLAMLRLPGYGNYPGPYGDLIVDRIGAERHLGQAVSAVNFDYRGFDTLGEEFILFAAVAGVAMLMRRQRGEHEESGEDRAADRMPARPVPVVVMLGTLLFPLGLVTGISMILHGHLTPGGGFQGGALCASAFLFVYLCGEIYDFERFTPDGRLDIAEAVGAAGFALTGLAGLATTGGFLANILPLGENGKLLSAGTIPLLNVVVGLEVAAGLMLVLAAFLRQAIEIRGGRHR